MAEALVTATLFQADGKPISGKQINWNHNVQICDGKLYAKSFGAMVSDSSGKASAKFAQGLEVTFEFDNLKKLVTIPQKDEVDLLQLLA